MTGREFLQSKWMKLAQQPGAADGIGRKLARWLRGVRNVHLLRRARELYDYFRSGNATSAQKVVMLAALLYLVSPLDIVPDWIPVAGLLDDLGVATFVLNYVFRRLDERETITGTDQPQEQ